MKSDQQQPISLEATLAARPFSQVPTRGRRSQLLPYRVYLLRMWQAGDSIEGMVSWLSTHGVRVSKSQVSRFVRQQGGEIRVRKGG